jgi:predicted site-specific integrase-resolvase
MSELETVGAAAGRPPVTAYRWFREGKLPVPARRAGRLILVEPSPVPETTSVVAVYARVSSADQKADLDRQVARVTAWAAREEGLAVGHVVTEVGPALNGKRRKFLALLRDQAVTTIVVEAPGPVRPVRRRVRRSRPGCFRPQAAGRGPVRDR